MFKRPENLELISSNIKAAGSGRLAIVIPQIDETLGPDAKLSYELLKKNAPDYPKFIVCPNTLKPKFDVSGFNFIRLNPSNFKGIAAYNALMMTEWFYEIFSNYTYILIYQNDALLLKNDLGQWLKKNYSYYGAPYFRRNGKLKSVGNGGFSLRHVEHHISVLRSHNIYPRKVTSTILRQYIKWTYLKYWVGYFFSKSSYVGSKRFIEKFDRAEDEFWIYFAPLFSKSFKIPSPEEVLDFAAESRPERVVELNNGIPLGVHAWRKHGRLFWINQLKCLGLIDEKITETDF